MIEESKDQLTFPKVYAVKHKDLNVRMNSRSGGVFTALSDRVLELKGTVYGCALNTELEAVHKRAVTKEERDDFRGSKYVQSNLLRTFPQVQQDLQEKKYVLFSGTSCQIEALSKFLFKEEVSKLLLIDIVCHGVPSPKVYMDYLHWMEEKKKGSVSHIDFRNKTKFGWAEQVETLTINGIDYDSKIYSNLFIRNLLLRPSCYRCPYKNMKHPGDITIADYWGIEQVIPGFSDNKGVSLVLVNTEKGDRWFRSVTDQLDYAECRIEDCLQPSLKAPAAIPPDRAAFWKDYEKNSFSYIVKKYAGYSWRTRLRLKDTAFWSRDRKRFSLWSRLTGK